MINTERHASSRSTASDGSGQMDDRALIQEFVAGVVSGQPKIASNPQLRVDVVFGEAHLLSKQEGMIARINLESSQAGLDVREKSPYLGLIQEALIPYDIFLMGKSQVPGFLRFEYRTVPEGYVAQYTEAGILWKDRWRRGKRRPVSGAIGAMSGVDAMILHRGTWYPIQSVTAANGFVVIRTLGHEATVSAADFILWLKKIEPDQNSHAATQGDSHEIGARMTTVANAPTQVLTPSPAEVYPAAELPDKIADAEEEETDQTILQTTPRYEVPDLPDHSQAFARTPSKSQDITTLDNVPPQYTSAQAPGYGYDDAAENSGILTMDTNAQMALTYLQSSLAYLLQVENKTPQVHAAIRATSVAIQNLLTILNS